MSIEVHSQQRSSARRLAASHFSPKEPGVFSPILDSFLTHGDHYMHLADLKSYLETDQRLADLYSEPKSWAAKAISNVAASGRFSSDRTIAEYAGHIWNVRPCPTQ